MKDPNKKNPLLTNIKNANSILPGPSIWIAGDPEDLKIWLERGAAGIVTNTVILNEMVKKYGQLTEVIKRYLDITDKPIAVEIDGHSTSELLEVGEIFTKMSDQIILKIPATSYALDAFTELKKSEITTFCTTIFTLNQCVAVAQSGATHLLPFCEPFKDVNGDPTKLIRECKNLFSNWENRPFITAALIRSIDTARQALGDGADGIIVFWPIFEEMIKNHLTEEWNKIFFDEWNAMYKSGNLKNIPVKYI